MGKEQGQDREEEEEEEEKEEKKEKKRKGKPGARAGVRAVWLGVLQEHASRKGTTEGAGGSEYFDILFLWRPCRMMRSKKRRSSKAWGN